MASFGELTPEAQELLRRLVDELEEGELNEEDDAGIRTELEELAEAGFIATSVRGDVFVTPGGQSAYENK